METYSPKESSEYPGLYEIPTYSRYVIAPSGLIFNTETKRFLRGSVNSDGYYNYRLTSDNNRTHTWGRHRIMAFVFKHPGIDVADLTVNHENGIKGDDRLDNLEWVTYQGNAEHAGANGLTTKCIPLSVRNVDTGEVVNYPSAIEYARISGLSKDAVLYRLKEGETRVFPERRQYRKTNVITPWFQPESVEHSILQNGTLKKVLLRDLREQKVMEFDSITALGQHLKLSASSLTQRLRQPGQPVFPEYVQMKWAHDPSPWREVGDLYTEVETTSGMRFVKTIHDATGESAIYSSAVQCAKARGLTPTALSYRLQSQGRRVFPDGYRYSYYADSVCDKPSWSGVSERTH